MVSNQVEHDVGGCRAAHARLLATLDGFTGDEGGRPSLLPGWTVGHVLTHLARNAVSHVGMLEAAGRGEVVDQYLGGREGRRRDIEAGAGRRMDQLVADVRQTCARLEATWDSMSPTAWKEGRGRMASGEVAVADLPFLRWREVEIHHVDLGLGFGWRDWSDGYVDLELERAIADLPERLPAGMRVRLEALDTDAIWEVPELAPEGSVLTSVSAPRRLLLAWLVGRADEHEFPRIAPWQREQREGSSPPAQ